LRPVLPRVKLPRSSRGTMYGEPLILVITVYRCCVDPWFTVTLRYGARNTFVQGKVIPCQSNRSTRQSTLARLCERVQVPVRPSIVGNLPAHGPTQAEPEDVNLPCRWAEARIPRSAERRFTCQFITSRMHMKMCWANYGTITSIICNTPPPPGGAPAVRLQTSHAGVVPLAPSGQLRRRRAEDKNNAAEIHRRASWTSNSPA
jgi:hypothetical protein